MTYGIRNKSTGAWVENCEFGTWAEAEAHLAAQWHREWIDGHEVAERSGTMGEQRLYWYDMGVVWTQGPLRPVPVATMGHDLSNVVNDDSMGERITGMLNALAGIPDPSAYVSRVAAMEEALSAIRDEHDTDGHFCRLCGGAGGRWPCATRLEADAALAKSALEGGCCNGKRLQHRNHRVS